MYAYVGSRTTRDRNARGDGISVFKFDPHSGALDLVQLVSGLVNPSYLALNRAGNRLYSVHGDETEVSAFQVDPYSGHLNLLSRHSTQGKNPVHLALDPSEGFLVVTNHIGASVVVLPVLPDGKLGAVEQELAMTGPIGPHRIEQQQAKPHFNLFDPSGRYVVVPDKGLDRVFSFAFEDGRLVPAASPFVETREGAGPRHAAFHPWLPIAYVVNELDSSVTTYRFDVDSGALHPLQVLPSIPPDFTGNSRAAGIAVDASGRTLYASNRGHDSIAVYRIDVASGLLEFSATTASGGRTPRFFTLSPDGALMFALNEESDNIVAFRVDPSTGQLVPTGQEVGVGSPVCMVFSGARSAPARE
jgi:6-phosphogluconolactonase (cycloisomerase 2 family)